MESHTGIHWYENYSLNVIFIFNPFNIFFYNDKLDNESFLKIKFSFDQLRNELKITNQEHLSENDCKIFA